MSEAKQITWTQYVNSVAPKFNEIAANGKHVTWAEESQFAIQALQKNPTLASCIPATVQNAVINVAAVGLTLNPALGYAYLVPENQKQLDGQYRQECMLRVSFKGLLKIATDSGSIMYAKAEIVKDKDTFIYNGPITPPEHKIANPFADRGPTVGVYCIAKTHMGDYMVDIMGMDDINKIRNAAKTKNVWDNWLDEMIKKAMLKRASKQWPKTDRDDRLDKAIAVVNEYEGSAEPIVTSPSLGEYTAETKEYFDQLITKQDSLNMFVLQCMLNERNDTAFTNLYHSFEKGQKGKYQRVVDDLLKQGYSLVTDIRQAFIDATEINDEMGMRELVEGLSVDAIQVIKNGLEFKYQEELDKLLAQ